MPFWLAKTRDAQDNDWIQRFDPRFWTVDFPRPMMASVVTSAPDALRVDIECHHRDALAGLIWASEDTLDHPLLAYETSRDYSHTSLSFRWRSGGLIPLDQPNGPTLTIEGTDASGTSRSWYVRLWNYAAGTPTDARITLPFSDLAGGYNIETSPDPVHPRAIDRMFISLPPTGFDPASTDLLPQRVNGWAELTDIDCDGQRSMLEIGDVIVPPHGTGMCTAYDDSYNQTPARLLRQMRGLGYRGEFVHYVGMSHYYRLADDDGALKADRRAILAEPAAAWHRDLFRRAVASGYVPIPSLSYELLAQDCPEDWQQRFADGTPALTGWSPPSALLTPGSADTVFFLRYIAIRFFEMLMALGAQPKFQIGEPWWWVAGDGRIALYDAKAAALWGATAPVIEDLRAPLSDAQRAVLMSAGYYLYISTLSIMNKLRQIGGPATDVRLLVFTPTVLDPEMPDQHLANLPVHWSYPRFDRLQLEDYDWLTAGAQAEMRRGRAFVQDKLKYPLDRQDYLAGFVLRAADADTYWQRIDAALDDARSRGVGRTFVWALPQVNRDGYTRLPPPQEPEMRAFDDVLYPLALGRDAAVAPEFSTNVMVTASGHERRSSLWSDARLHFDVGPGIRSEAELGTLIAFFRARRGAARGFRVGDPFDHSSNGMTGTPTMGDQLLGTGDGLRADFALHKLYGPADEPQLRPITRPRVGSIVVGVGGEPASGWTLEPGGIIRLSQAPADKAEVRAGFLFDVPVRFAQDRLDVNAASFAAGEAPSVPLIEVREAT